MDSGKVLQHAILSTKAASRQGKGAPIIPGKFDRDGIPKFLDSGLLPMAEYGVGGEVLRTSPFRCQWSDLEDHLCWTEQRKGLFVGFRTWVKDLNSAGVRLSAILIGGGFVELVDKPKDIDVVALYRAPEFIVSKEEMIEFTKTHANLFEKRLSKAKYGCDPTYLLLSNSPERLAAAICRELTFLSCSRLWLGKGILWLIL